MPPSHLRRTLEFRKGHGKRAPNGVPMPEMRTAQMDAPEKPLSLVRRPVPEPGPGEILVKVIACGMCYTEVNELQGDYPFARFPVIPGHEITGTVAALGT